MAGSSIMESLFQRSLEDLIKGLRLQMIGESQFISKSMEEIRREIKSTDPHTKSIALQKLTYLHSLHGVDMSWAAFHVVEVMSYPRFHHKKIGYLAAVQSFNDNTDVLLLITNQLRKDLTSSIDFEVSLALQCLSTIATSDLARDLTNEIFTLLSTSRIYVKKKAIGVILRFFSKYPDAVKVVFKRLVENLENSDPAATSAAVGVFCELTSKDPTLYLPLAPEFYRILIDSKNNWVLIKVIKIFARLAPLEPRLAKRVVEPICEHMRKTGAKSLMFECIRTVVTSLAEYESAVKLALLKIREFLLDDDSNLKYLGLKALSIVAEKHLWAVLENKEIVIKSLNDEDPNIKLESLHLVMAMVSENNVAEICRVLVNYALKSDPQFCNEILESILSTCCRNFYQVIVDFDWYVSVLGEMARIPNCQKGVEIEKQIIDIGMRVTDVRSELVRVSRDLLIDPALLGNLFIHKILSAAAWASGEYVEFSKNPLELMEALLQPRTTLLPSSIRAVYIQSAFKVLIFCLHSYFLHTERSEDFNPRNSNEDKSVEDGGDLIVKLINLVENELGPLSGSHEVEVQERARNILNFVELIKQELNGNFMQEEWQFDSEKSKALKFIEAIHASFSNELGPVSSSAQERISIPDGLLLKENLSDLETICGDFGFPTATSLSLFQGEGVSLSKLSIAEEPEPSTESTSLLAEHRKRHGLYYLPSEKNDILSNDYPLANESTLKENFNDDTEVLVGLAEQSLGSKKKPNHSKPRPVVLKLDEGDEVPPASAKKSGLKDDSLSGAVTDVLLGNSPNPSDNLSNSRKGKEKVNVDGQSSIKSKHHSHDKGRKPKSSEKNEENGKKERQSSHRHGRSKARNRAEAPVNVAPQTTVIPDFLL